MGCRRRNCCNCTECCGGHPPDGWLATFVFPNTGTSTCGLCASFLSGEYFLAREDCDSLCTDETYYPESTPCCWKYDWEGDEECTLGGAGAGEVLHITELHIEMQIRCTPDSAVSEICFLQLYFIGYIESNPSLFYGKLWQWDSPAIGDPKTNARKCRSVINAYNARLTGLPFPADLTHLLADICSNTPTVALVAA